MKQMTSGMLAFLGVLAVAGCYSYTGDAINNANYNELQATPNFVVVRVGDSDQLIARLVNAANNGAVTSYTVSNVGAGVAVHYQAGYRPIFSSARDTLVITGDKNAQQYYVVGVTTGTYSFTLTPTSVNTGVSATVNVVVTPRDLGPALSKTTGAAGDTIVITAPLNTIFSDTSSVSFTTGVVSVIARAADHSSITIVVSGGVTGPATVTAVLNKLVPTVLPVTLVTNDSLRTTPENLPTLSVTNAAAGATVVLTAGANTYFTPTSAITFTTGSTSTPVLAADSSTLTFLVGPGITGPATVTNVGLRSAKTLPLNTLVSTNTLTTTALTSAPVTIANSTPALGTTTTIQLGSGLRFLGTSHVFVGGAEAGIQSVSADSSTATVSLMTGSTGTVTFTNIALSFLTSVPLALPSTGTMTVGSVYSGPTDANANVAASATTIALNKSQSLMINDGGALSTACPAGLAATFGGSSCRYYKITLVAGAMSARIKWNSGAVSDLGVFLVNSAGTACVATLADDQGQVSGSVGDHNTQVLNCAEGANLSITAGTYLLTVVEFNYGTVVVPAWYQVLISQP